jgi:hypothetical protein
VTSKLLATRCDYSFVGFGFNFTNVVTNRKEVETMADHESELELELEDEFHEGEFESEDEAGMEGEGWLGTLGNIAGSLLSESEDELEDEFEDEGEDEAALEGEGWLGALGNIAGGLLSEGEDEFEGEDEYEFEFEDETEQFSFGRFFKKALPILKKVAKVAAPIVGSAIGGPIGGKLGSMAAGALEGEYEDEEEGEFEDESESEVAHEIAAHELTHNEAVAEMMAEAASHEAHEGEAEAMAGAAVITVISPRDRRALRRILPHLTRGTAILTRILRRRRSTRAGVRAVPTIMRRTVKSLKRQAAKGVKITRGRAGRTAAKQIRSVLGNPKACAAAIRRNAKVSSAYKRPRRVRRSNATRRRRSTLR